MRPTRVKCGSERYGAIRRTDAGERGAAGAGGRGEGAGGAVQSGAEQRWAL
jgi:hypothetical protein